MNIVLSAGSVHHLDVETRLWLAQAAGFDAIELILDEQVAKFGLPAVERAMKGYGLPIHTIHAPFNLVPAWGDFWGNVRQALEWAKQLRSNVLTVHGVVTPGWFGLGRRRFARRMAGVREVAGRGITVTIENLPRSCRLFGRLAHPLRSLDAVTAFAREAGIKLTFDTAHLGTWGVPLIAAFRREADLIANVHFSDLDGSRQHLLPKSGRLPLSEFLTAAHQLGYTGPITLEVRPAALKDGGPDVVLPILIATRKWIKRHSGRGQISAAAGQ